MRRETLSEKRPRFAGAHCLLRCALPTFAPGSAAVPIPADQPLTCKAILAYQ